MFHERLKLCMMYLYCDNRTYAGYSYVYTNRICYAHEFDAQRELARTIFLALARSAYHPCSGVVDSSGSTQAGTQSIN